MVKKIIHSERKFFINQLEKNPKRKHPTRFAVKVPQGNELEFV